MIDPNATMAMTQPASCLVLYLRPTHK
jgi:hypothetical protein